MVKAIAQALKVQNTNIDRHPDQLLAQIYPHFGFSPVAKDESRQWTENICAKRANEYRPWLRRMNNLPLGVQRIRLGRIDGPITALDLSADGRRAVIAGGAQIMPIDISQGCAGKVSYVVNEHIVNVVYCPEWQNHVLCVTREGSLVYLDLQTGVALERFIIGEKAVAGHHRDHVGTSKTLACEGHGCTGAPPLVWDAFRRSAAVRGRQV